MPNAQGNAMAQTGLDQRRLMIRDDDQEVLPACFIGASCQNTAHCAKHYPNKVTTHAHLSKPDGAKL
jgi:hypothetical protein